MKCPFCAHLKDRVVDSRETGPGDAIRRRRECGECGRRFTSYERIEEIPYFVVKKDGRRETFDRQKLTSGLHRACEKRPVSAKSIEAIVDAAEQMVQDSTDREVETRQVGEMVMQRLRELDKVAYVRFASVYRRFEDVEEFMAELRSLQSKRAKEGELVMPITLAPLMEMARIQSEINRLFDNLLDLGGDAEAGSAWIPNADILETSDTLVVQIELPGVERTNLALAVHGGNVIVQGEKSRPALTEHAEFHAVERAFGQFRRVIHLGVPVNTRLANAVLKDGLLRIIFPKVPNRRGEEVPIEVQCR